jgi:CTP:molybdopterin cytidylyltransferase MocA
VKQIGLVLCFKPHVTKEDVAKVVEALEKRNAIEGYEVGEYNPNIGTPVFYVP